MSDPTTSPTHRIATSQSVRFGEFEFEVDTRRLHLAGILVPLQPKPTKVLWVLLQQAGKVVPRDDLRRMVWGEETHLEFDQSLNVCIRQIRVALSDDARRPQWVETVPRRGYRFLGPVTAEPPADQKHPDNVAQQADSEKPRRHVWLVRLALFSLLVVLLIQVSNDEPPTPNKAAPRLVVLPLDSRSQEPANQHIADLLTDELVAQLGAAFASQIGVLARSSTLQLDPRPSLPELYEQLAVEYVVEGTVQRLQDRLRASVQIIRLPDEIQVWSQLFERPWSERFRIPAEVGTAAVLAVAGQLPETQQRSRDWSLIAPPEAYEQFLNARQLMEQRSADANLAAQEALTLSLELYPELAPALAALGETHLRKRLHPKVKVPLARQAALQALEIDPALPAAWLLLARIQLRFDWNLAAARESLDRALELNPTSSDGHHTMAMWLSAKGRGDEAIAEFELAKRLDPLSQKINTDSAWLYLMHRRLGEAEAAARQALRIHPRSVGGHLMLYSSLRLQGRSGQAAISAGHVLEHSGVSEARLARHRALPPGAALQLFEQQRLKALLALRQRVFHAPGEIALAAVAAGDHELALSLLGEAVAEHSDWRALWMRQDPRLDPLRDDPRFRQILESVSLG